MAKSSCSNIPKEDMEARLVDASILQLVENGISTEWMELGRALDVPDSQLGAISVNYSAYGVKEMSHQMLKTWQETKSKDATVAFLATTLQGKGRKDLADKILKIPPNVDEGSPIEQGGYSQSEWLKQLNKSLHQDYVNQVMKGLPWMHRNIFTLDHYYVDLSLQISGSSKTEQAANVSEVFKSAFSASNRVLRVLVEGAPGYGKTTLAAKLCFDHAKGEPFMANFDLVLRFSLRYFEGSLEDIFYKAAELSYSRDKQILLKILNNPAYKVLLLLDGFDELPQQHVKTIFALIRGKKFPDLVVVVTSRPGQFTFERWEKESDNCEQKESTTNWNNIWQCKIKILGLNKCMREIFIKKHLEGPQKSITNNILDELKRMEKDDIIAAEFLQCPLFLLMVILLLTDEENSDIQSLSTKTELYKRVFNFIVRRFCSKQNKPTKEKVDLFTASEASKPFFVKLVSQFGEFAIWALAEKKLSFSQEEILGKVNARDPKILEMGLITESVYMIRYEEKHDYEPVHKSLLEFAAAYTLWLQFPDTNHYTWMNKVFHLTQHENNSSWLLMLIGLMEQPCPFAASNEASRCLEKSQKMSKTLCQIV